MQDKEAVYARRRRWLLVAVIVLVIALIGMGYLGYRTFTKRLEAARQLDRATALVEDADRLVVQIDDVISAQVTSDSVERARGAQERVEEAQPLLKEAIGLIDAGMDDLTDDEQERATLLRGSAAARQKMLEQAPEILEANAQAGSALVFAQQGWDSLLEADKLTDQAVASYNKLTRAGVLESKRLNRQAASELALARERFTSAERAFAAAPFEQYLTYVDTRVSLNRLSLRSDEAWLRGDLAEANRVIETYNKEDRTAVAQAKNLSASPAVAVADAYESATRTAKEAYSKAKQSALAADERLKAF